jgi:hypothetical protein
MACPLGGLTVGSPKKQSPQWLVYDTLAERSSCFSNYVCKLFIAMPIQGEIASARGESAAFAMTEALTGKKKHGFVGVGRPGQLTGLSSDFTNFDHILHNHRKNCSSTHSPFAQNY